MQDVCHLSVYDNMLKHGIIGRSSEPSPAELMNCTSFKNMWDATITAALDDSAEARVHADRPFEDHAAAI